MTMTHDGCTGHHVTHMNGGDKSDEHTMLDGTASIPLYKTPPTYRQFFEHHLRTLQPCLIGQLADAWAVSERWLSANEHDGRSSLRTDVLKQELGSMIVSISGPGIPKPEQSTMSDFLERMAAGEVIYAKDVHLQAALTTPSQQDHFYSCPALFEDDYLNFYLVHGDGGDDYKFLYLGNRGTRTLLHRDVVASHSWSSNLVGWKRWWLIDPEHVPLIHSLDGECASDLFLGDEATRQKWPRLTEAREAALVVDQAPGQTIFVPSGWYHQVLNLGCRPTNHDHNGQASMSGEGECCDPVLSINQNWFNSVCLSNIYRHLQLEHAKSADAVKDLLDDGILSPGEPFKTVVESLTKANVGLDFTELFDMVRYRLIHSEHYVSSQHLPPPDYEAAAIRSICERWLESGLRTELPRITNLVNNILETGIDRLV